MVWLRSFFSKWPHKWTNSSRLKVLLWGPSNSRLSLVRLTCLFRLKTQFYSPEASHAHPTLPFLPPAQIKSDPEHLRTGMLFKWDPVHSWCWSSFYVGPSQPRMQPGFWFKSGKKKCWNEVWKLLTLGSSRDLPMASWGGEQQQAPGLGRYLCLLALLLEAVGGFLWFSILTLELLKDQLKHIKNFKSSFEQ